MGTIPIIKRADQMSTMQVLSAGVGSSKLSKRSQLPSVAGAFQASYHVTILCACREVLGSIGKYCSSSRSHVLQMVMAKFQ